MLIELNNKLGFGKYANYTVKELFANAHRRTIQRRVNYLKWLERKTNHTLSEEVKETIRRVVDYYDLGWGNMNQDMRPRTDLYFDDNIEGDNPHTVVSN